MGYFITGHKNGMWKKRKLSTISNNRVCIDASLIIDSELKIDTSSFALTNGWNYEKILALYNSGTDFYIKIGTYYLTVSEESLISYIYLPLSGVDVTDHSFSFNAIDKKTSFHIETSSEETTLEVTELAENL